MQRFVDRYYSSLLLLLVAIAFLSRVYRVYIPEKYIFDEVYHVVTAKLIAHNDPRAYEWSAKSDEADTAIDWLHPPGAKLLQAGSMVLFGENSFAWRLSSVVFGTLIVLTIAWLAQALFSDKRLSLLSALFAASDGLLLVQSRIAMNDIHATFFMLQALLWYWRYRQTELHKYFFVAVLMAGCAVASKWSGIFSIGVIGLFEIVCWQKQHPLKPQIVRLLQNGVLLLLFPSLIYLGSYGQMWLQGKSWDHFVSLHKQIWAYQTTLTATHPYQSAPWQWFLNLRPVWISVEYGSDTRADIYAFGNPALFFWGAVAVVLTVILSVKHLRLWLTKKKLPKSALAISFLFFSYLMVWVPWTLSPRVMFFYHYTPAVPLLCILLAYWVLLIPKFQRVFVICILASVVLAAVVWYPHWTQLPVANEFANQVYFYFETWR
ncbi:MAG: hypothetical protein A3J60_02260 [Candidatus Pacebacteria bacterium RIFCSPHIGHO2_02_FULL_46_9]|nr:MAG: hypothetical protein A3J60_02260 [Candidatus Pacebacteria bacterium RIFCSPHIGHO2_02_FULL_46_9]